MKKTSIFIATLLLFIVCFAQNPVNPNAKLNYIVGEFSGDYSASMRTNVIRELTMSHRANVIVKEAYEALPQSVRSKMHIDAIITGKCSLKTETKQTTRTDENGVKKNVTLYNSIMTTEMKFTDPVKNFVILTPIFESKTSEEDRKESVNKAIAVGYTRGKQTFVMVQLLTLEEYLQDRYPLRGKIVTINEVNKNSAKSVTINLGGRDAVFRSETFEIVSMKNGKEKNYGRLRVREINNDSLSTCRVDKGGKEIMKAIESGEDVEIVSYVQALDLNGIVRAEQEAPRLEVTSIDEVKRRNIAFGGICGDAPSVFIDAIKENMTGNLRINAYDLASTSLDNLDGIAYGYYTGMKTSSRLVKAEDHLLQLKDYTEYETTIGWYLFIVNPQNGEIVYSGSQGYTAISDKSEADATKDAVKNASDITSATYRAYPLIGNITTVDDADPEKAKEVSIDLGSNYPVYKNLVFDVYSVEATGGWERIGRLGVKEVVDGGRSVCEVQKGGEKIQKAIEEGLPLRITTYTLKGLFEL